MKYNLFLQCLGIVVLLMNTTIHKTYADPQDPFDPFSRSWEDEFSSDEDEHKSALELVSEAEYLLIEERPLDARSKLLKALRKDPDNYEAHSLLSGYYLVHVGHFRLALRYILRAKELFQQQNGPAPYLDPVLRNQHAYIIQLLSQARLNLDDYQGALSALDEYSSLGYFSGWYPSSRAWILMKLGRMDEAIRTARSGLAIDKEPGRTLNILGILLSMSGQRQEALSIFDQAINGEFALGKLGQPATPLNNSGEVFREIFEEDRAERRWIRATSLPDGCEHVLPSLNLAVLYIEQTKYRDAKETIDKFESCVAQYPLRNGEEHKALVHLARGRIALHTGYPSEAIRHFEQALERRQWFGKIGASGEDLLVAALSSLGQALLRENAHEAFRLKDGLSDSINSLWKRFQNSIKAKWYFRKARKILVEDLNSFEDLFIRNTDSILEYPTLGEVLSGFPTSILKQRINQEIETDNRERALPYYQAYLAENMIRRRQSAEGLSLLNAALERARDRYDQALTLHLLLFKLRYVSLDQKEKQDLSESVYLLSKAALRNHGLPLPVNFEFQDSKIQNLFSGSPIELDNGPLSEFIVLHRKSSSGEHEFIFRSRSGIIQEIRYSGTDERETIREFLDRLFTQRL